MEGHMTRLSRFYRSAAFIVAMAVLVLGPVTPAAASGQYAILAATCGGVATVTNSSPWGDYAEVACSVSYGPEPTRTPVASLPANATGFLPGTWAGPGPWQLETTTLTFEPALIVEAGARVTNITIDGTFTSLSTGRAEQWDGRFVLNFLFDPPATPAEQTQDAIHLIAETATLPAGTQSSLLSSLTAAQTSLESGSTTAACGQLTSFTKKVSAQSGKSIDPGLAAQLTAAAEEIKSTAGCQ